MLYVGLASKKGTKFYFSELQNLDISVKGFSFWFIQNFV